MNLGNLTPRQRLLLAGAALVLFVLILAFAFGGEETGRGLATCTSIIPVIIGGFVAFKIGGKSYLAGLLGAVLTAVVIYGVGDAAILHGLQDIGGSIGHLIQFMIWGSIIGVIIVALIIRTANRKH